MRHFFYFLILLMVGCNSVNPSIHNSISNISQSKLRRHIEVLTEDGPRFSPKQINETIEYIEKQLKSMGYEVVEEPYKSRYGPSRNIYAEKTGSSCPSRIVEIGAHFDTVSQSPGADDNASGVAAQGSHYGI